MKIYLVLLIALLLIIPTSVNASEVVSYVVQFIPSVEQKVEQRSEVQVVEKKKLRCEVGFKLDYDKNICHKVIVPAHAQLSGTGDDFACDRDYKLVGDSCEKLI